MAIGGEGETGTGTGRWHLAHLIKFRRRIIA